MDGRQIRRVRRVLNHKVVQRLYRQSQLQSTELGIRNQTTEQRKHNARFQSVKRDVESLSPVS